MSRKSIGCTPIIEHGIYARATYKEWQGRKLTFEGKINLSEGCRVKKEFQYKYPGSSRRGIICSINEDSNGCAEFWLCFRSDVEGMYYHSWVPFGYIDWEDYFRLTQ